MEKLAPIDSLVILKLCDVMPSLNFKYLSTYAYAISSLVHLFANIFVFNIDFNVFFAFLPFHTNIFRPASKMKTKLGSKESDETATGSR
ncbi:unnamed protein product [Acanthoscelides obtectus]|uniref:Uncharacterized protein n=1 Tax=Acanthoscelides obtectus TaxID=200917 RepID=A0A9P0PJT7_ACAOB|nr:unnamed protein product [Acanthoscelides obtectus]CAK1622286.1 hypothetical protein AOBTE_LOCUS1413 [Acanthoscelides obtectus]